MIAKPIATFLASSLMLADCQQRAENPSAPGPTPTATVTVAVPVPVPVPSASSAAPLHDKGIGSSPDPELCGADKLGPYLELLPTSTAKGEIAKTVGHNRIRYIPPGSATTQGGRPDRLTAVLGVDGRIKEFHCG